MVGKLNKWLLEVTSVLGTEEVFNKCDVVGLLTEVCLLFSRIIYTVLTAWEMELLMKFGNAPSFVT